ncbi:MAG: DUF2993 domain-containing protein [Actinomycetota bacterium]
MIPLVILGALYVAADYTAKKVAEDRLSSSIGAQFHMKDDPKVSIASFPFIIDALARHRVGSATVVASDVTIDELELTNVHVELRAITSTEFLSTSGITVSVGNVAATADVPQTSLQRFLTTRGYSISVVLHEGSAAVTARRTVFGRSRTFSATGSVAIRGGRLVFLPTTLKVDGGVVPSVLVAAARSAVSFSVAVPALPGKVRPSKVALHEGAVSLSATGTNATVRFGGGAGL